MTDFNQKTHDTDVGSHGGQSRRMTEEERKICRNRNVEKYMYL